MQDLPRCKLLGSVNVRETVLYRRTVKRTA